MKVRKLSHIKWMRKNTWYAFMVKSYFTWMPFKLSDEKGSTSPYGYFLQRHYEKCCGKMAIRKPRYLNLYFTLVNR